MELYPDIKWVVQKPTADIEEDYGKGFVLSGTLGETSTMYFILEEDPRKDNWIHMIANQLKEEK